MQTSQLHVQSRYSCGIFFAQCMLCVNVYTRIPIVSVKSWNGRSLSRISVAFSALLPLNLLQAAATTRRSTYTYTCPSSSHQGDCTCTYLSLFFNAFKMIAYCTCLLASAMACCGEWSLEVIISTSWLEVTLEVCSELTANSNAT